MAGLGMNFINLDFEYPRSACAYCPSMGLSPCPIADGPPRLVDTDFHTAITLAPSSL